MSLTPRTLTLTLPDVVGGVAYAQLTATLANASTPATLAGTGVGPIYASPLAQTGGTGPAGARLALYCNDDAGSSPAGTGWAVWADLILADGREAKLPPQTIQLFTSDPEPVDLSAKPPVTTTTYTTYALAADLTAHEATTLADGAHGGLAGLGIPTQATLLIGWAAGEEWAESNVVYNANEVVTSMDLVWPDGSAGTYTAVTIDPTWLEATAWTATHTNSGKTVSYGTLTRDSSGHIIDPPATYSVA